MKVSTICSLLLAAGSTIAAPAKRTEQAISISGLSASQTDQQGYIAFTLKDPNYDDSTGANVIWHRPGSPVSGARTSDGAYYVNFPGGVNDIAVFTLEVQRVKSTETVSVTLNGNGNGSASGTKWSCTSANDSVGGPVEKCAYDGDITLTPFNS
ncbi:uncharacterized protein NFIA_001160 [Aspergillus fischeri NRRL 181]|uniref:Uncharacterized protein n=1 Tax=Neosartorya fischeri (strain ATCC 1020 / DSM 3700 / CBS 544.65 / FGSC A1164 / JCM 1740 / NRRL 181 / WB 181) TaxID=331117 RepID=A1DJ80_NEOFI|nr:conserved hypothetical protein [Aspergillus fischeri NRRL 181]EAW16769.1 conserved hypothetical protein [Aspergillus fischeri NRRL 181]KAG2002051.1 hypothetical protein GB937_009816 [Aspergillus fischeri]